MSNQTQSPPRISPQGFPLPPCYWELFTEEAKNDPNHPDHFVFTPPPPFAANRADFTRYNSSLPLGKEPLTIRQKATQEHVLYSIPASVPPSHRSGPNGHLVRFHPDVDYKGELAKLNLMLAQEYGYMIQGISTPQPNNLPFLFPEHFGAISLIISNITHLTGILREHQAKQQILAHVKHQTALNKAKTQRLNDLNAHFETLLKPDCDVDAVLETLSAARPPGPAP